MEFKFLEMRRTLHQDLVQRLIQISLDKDLDKKVAFLRKEIFQFGEWKIIQNVKILMKKNLIFFKNNKQNKNRDVLNNKVQEGLICDRMEKIIDLNQCIILIMKKILILIL